MFWFFKRRKTANQKTQEDADYEATIAQRYCNLMAPHFVADQRSELKKAIDAEIGEQGNTARLQGKTLQQLDQEKTDAANSVLRHEREILANGYHMSKDDFCKIILPILSQFSFMPDHDRTTFGGTMIWDAMYRISSTDYRTYAEAKDELTGFCDTWAVSDVLKRLRSNYELLRRSAMLDYRCVLAGHNKHACQACRAMAETNTPVAGLLENYANLSLAFPHEMPHNDVANWCAGPNLYPAKFDD